MTAPPPPPIKENSRILLKIPSLVLNHPFFDTSAANKAISTYPNGVDQAVKDIRAIINTVLKGVNNIDSVATIGAGAAKLTHNHSFIQSLAWVASYDSWFNDLASDKNADIEVLDIEDVDLTFNPIATAARAKAA